MSQKRTRRGFTLVELLVVVGVLVFVIAMLFPAFAKAQRQARTVTCLANVHQLYMGYAAYLPQNHQHSLRYDPTFANLWPHVLRPTFPDVKDILICPEANVPSYGLGSAKSAWGPYDAARGSSGNIAFIGAMSSSYGFNGFLYAKDDAMSNSRWIHSHTADSVPVFAEATWLDGWPVTSETSTTEIPAAGRADDAGLARFDIARHGRSINISFLDGHAAQIPLEQLPTLKWSNPSPFDSAGFPQR